MWSAFRAEKESILFTTCVCFLVKNCGYLKTMTSWMVVNLLQELRGSRFTVLLSIEWNSSIFFFCNSKGRRSNERKMVLLKRVEIPFAIIVFIFGRYSMAELGPKKFTYEKLPLLIRFWVKFREYLPIPAFFNENALRSSPMICFFKFLYFEEIN